MTNQSPRQDDTTAAADSRESAHPNISSLKMIPGRNGGKSPPIATLEDFLERAYQKKGKIFTLRKSDARKIAASELLSTLSDEHARRVREDQLLSVPASMLLAALSHRSQKDTYERLLGLIRLALLEHPVTAAVFDEDGLHAISFESFTDTLLRAVSIDLAEISSKSDKNSIAPSKVQLLRQNLVHIVGLWATACSSMSIESILEELCITAWQRSASRYDQKEQVWRAILDMKDTVPLGIVSRPFNSRVYAAQSETRDMARERDTGLRRIHMLEDELASVRRELEHQTSIAKEEATSLHEKLEDALAGQSHLRDEFERLRTRVLRALSREVDLLDEGILALRRDPPRVKVMLDHAERAADGMRTQIGALRGESV